MQVKFVFIFVMFVCMCVMKPIDMSSTYNGVDTVCSGITNGTRTIQT